MFAQTKPMVYNNPSENDVCNDYMDMGQANRQLLGCMGVSYIPYVK